MRICRFILVSLIFTASIAAQNGQPGAGSGVNRFDPSNYIWFSIPAAKWDEALPVGNGRLGAMIFGGIAEERLQLNEDTYWSGGPYSTVVKGGYKVLPEIQRLVFAERYLDAHNLFGRNLMGYPVEQQKYQSLANLHLFFDHGKDAKDYQRSLDLKTGISTTTYTANGITYKREVIASAPDQVIAVRLTADPINASAGALIKTAGVAASNARVSRVSDIFIQLDRLRRRDCFNRDACAAWRSNAKAALNRLRAKRMESDRNELSMGILSCETRGANDANTFPFLRSRLT